MIVDLERLVSRYLRTHPAVAALGARVVLATPESTATAWVKVAKLDGRQTDPADHLTDFLVQIDCYAGAGSREQPDANGHTGGRPEANLLGQSVREALRLMPDVAHEQAIVTATRIVGDRPLPDGSFTLVRERVVLTAQVWAHATPGA